MQRYIRNANVPSAGSRVGNISVDLRKLHFGDDAAEGDKYLKNAFVVNAALENVIYDRANLILGPKGSGKSAIFKIVHELSEQISAQGSSEKNNTEKCFTAQEYREIEDYKGQLSDKLFVRLNETHNVDAYKFLVEQKNANDPEKFKVLWLIYFCILTAKKIIDKAQYLQTNYKSLDKLKSLIEPFDLQSCQSSNLTEIFLKIIRKINISLEWKGFALKIQHNDNQVSPQPYFNINLHELITIEEQILSEWGLRATILIDRLDDFYKYDKKKMQYLVQGLFLALEDMRESEFINQVVFLRTDIYERMELEDTDKFRGAKIEVIWDMEESLLFMAKRIMLNKEIRELIGTVEIDKSTVELLIKIFYPTFINHLDKHKNRKEIAFKKWFTTHFQNAFGYISPRDIMHFLAEIVKNELKADRKKVTSTPIVSEKSVLSAYYAISKEKFKDIKTISGCEDLLEFIKSNNYSSFNLKKIKNTLGDSNDEQLVRSLKVLESLGFCSSKASRANKDSYIYSYNVAPIYTAHWFATND